MDGSSRRESALTFSPEENERTHVLCYEIYGNIATRHFDFVGVEVTRLISNSGCRFSVRDSSRRLLRHGEGETFAVPLKIPATGFAGYPQNQNRPAAISSPIFEPRPFCRFSTFNLQLSTHPVILQKRRIS